MSKVHDDSASAATISPTYNPTSRQPVNCSARTTCYAAKAVVAGVATVLLTGWLAVSAAEVVAVNFGGGCPSACSGHGYCTAPKSETCSCYQGWGGGDCSIRLCPSGTAWVDHATDNNTAHAAYTECSNMGVCDRSTGRCSCRAGFTGEACQRLTCSANCNGRGRCMSIRGAAAVADGQGLIFEGMYGGWDADMIHGCLCDDGWEGYDCSLRTCPKGIDPYPSAEGVPEEQVVDCFCPGQCSGSLLLGFRGYSTRPIPYDASAELVKYRLEEITAVDEVLVNITGPGATMCNGSDGSTTRVTFLLQYGALSNMTVDTYTLKSSVATPVLTVFAKGQSSEISPGVRSQAGTKEAVECSGRGHCNRQTGHCMCYDKFRSSNGMVGPGDLGDCGYVSPDDPPTNCSTAVPIWGWKSSLCSGVGECNMTSLTCNCTEPYSGGACELMTCGTGVPWFEQAASNLTVGSAGGRNGVSVQCSAGGTCDESTGTCDCRNRIFSGDACEKMACPSCNGVGSCSDMQRFAATARLNGEAVSFNYDLWDANMMRSCWCDRSRAVDSTYSGFSNTYRGPYSFADTDWFGFDCSQARCPTGDHYHTYGVGDVQRVNCTGYAGVFSLSFRGGSTKELSYATTAEELEAALEATHRIFDVDVTYYNGKFACNDTDYINIEFLTENGDLPLLVPDSRFLYLSDGTTHGQVTVTKIQTGTREDVECAAQGICVESTGTCDCFVGYQSSNGTGSIGERGDCGWRNKYQTELFSGNGTAADFN